MRQEAIISGDGITGISGDSITGPVVVCVRRGLCACFSKIQWRLL